MVQAATNDNCNSPDVRQLSPEGRRKALIVSARSSAYSSWRNSLASKSSSSSRRSGYLNVRKFFLTFKNNNAVHVHPNTRGVALATAENKQLESWTPQNISNSSAGTERHRCLLSRVRCMTLCSIANQQIPQVYS